jgi:hypothetical protein
MKNISLGILTEDFAESRVYRPLQLNNYFRALVPDTKLTLKQQFLLTPMYLKDSWNKILKENNQLNNSLMQPRIILINDNEHIPRKQRDCYVYVQYLYENDAVLGADRAYQLMLPDRGPTSPARPLMISPAKISKVMERKLPRRPELALREAPVYVYHQNGHAFYENLAQYLAGKQARLSPQTARKFLQFADVKEFEEYLASKVTREEARRMANESGESKINVDKITNNLMRLLETNESVSNGGKDESVYYHFDECEYDPLRPKNNINNHNNNNNNKSDLNDTQEYIVNGKKIKSTFIALRDNDKLEKVQSRYLENRITI